MAYDCKSALGRAGMGRINKWVGRRGMVTCAVIVGLLALCAWLGVREPEPEPEPAKTVQRHDSLTHTYTHDGTDTIRVYVVTDPDMGIQYVVSDHGGITPRLDRYGRVMGTMTE